eukprot:379661-Prymnesium_polylepis.1
MPVAFAFPYMHAEQSDERVIQSLWPEGRAHKIPPSARATDSNCVRAEPLRVAARELIARPDATA